MDIPDSEVCYSLDDFVCFFSSEKKLNMNLIPCMNTDEETLSSAEFAYFLLRRESLIEFLWLSIDINILLYLRTFLLNIIMGRLLQCFSFLLLIFHFLTFLLVFLVLRYWKVHFKFSFFFNSRKKKEQLAKPIGICWLIIWWTGKQQ